MKKTVKKAAFFLALLTALSLPALSLAVTQEEAAQLAVDAVGGGATPGRVERDDGLFEVSLSLTGARAQVDVRESDGAIVEIEIDYLNAARAKSFSLGEDGAREAVLKEAPGAQVELVLEERDDGACVYEAFYATQETRGLLALNGETGEVAEDKRWPLAAEQGVMGAADALAKALEREPDAELAELSLSYERNGYEYDGELFVGKTKYSFEMDAATGAIREWERDD